ncbi:ER lumen protein-retaining receptor 2 (ERD2) [Vairimorpha necatrix]|uniref:ER lumen protein-retaining receptor 2 (ERD2) n=1 Tax=Vairimorpha necatrix TaxID=6039 RepID=A0AAX4JBS1_9MICR
MNVETVANLLRYLGDLVHISSKVVLASKIEKTKSCSGLSFKTQFLYLLVFISRYFDIFEVNIRRFKSIYNFVLKLTFISFQCLVVYLIRKKYYSTYDRKTDVFQIRLILVPVSIISLLLKPSTNGVYDYISEYLYTFSLILESVSILPQLVQLQEEGECESRTSTFIFLLGGYRFLYTLYFILKKISVGKVGTLLVTTGTIQVILYADFFSLYYRYVFSKKNNNEIEQ